MKIFERLRVMFSLRVPFSLSLLIGILMCIPAAQAFTQEKTRNDQVEDENFDEERANFRFLQRANEDGEIPLGALIRAKEEVDAMRMRSNAKIKTRSPQDAGIWNWEWLGPGNIGGRIRSILISPDNPSTMWIGSVSGGIWRTDNGGNVSWYPVDDFMANLAVTSLVMDPTNHNVMYAATGEGTYSQHNPSPGLRGAGIFKSVDGGISWSQLASTNNSSFVFVSRLSHHPSTSNTLIAAAGNAVWRTTDGGATPWTRVLPNGTYPTISNTVDVKYHPTDGSRILVGGVSDAYYSTDGGNTWNKQSTGPPKLPSSPGECDVAFARTSSSMYVSITLRGGQIWRSTNNGATWDSMNTGSNYISQGNTNAIWVDPTDANTVVVGGLDLWRSRNGGTNLDHISAWPCYPDCGGIVHSAHADQHFIIEHPNYNGTNNRIVYVGNDGGIQYTTDIYAAGNGGLGDGWANLAHNLGITQFYSGAAAPDGSVIVGGSQDNDKLRYRPSDGPNGWHQAETGDGGVSAVDYISPNYAYGEYVFLRFKRSDDGGGGWGDKFNGLGDAQDGRHAAFVAPFSMDPNNPTILVAGGTSIWRTTNRGDSWSRIRDSLGLPGPKCSAIDIEKGNSSTIWVGYGDGTVSRTSDGGANWTNVDGGFTPLPDRYVTDIAINPFDGNEVFVTFGGYNSNDVWRTVDFGISWTRRTGSGADSLPALQVNTVRFHPANPNWIYIGTDLGVFASEDKGLTWSISPLYANNEGPANVEVDELSWQGSQYLIAATHGRGMFRCRPLPVIFVDIANPNPGDGSQGNPYHSIADAINAAGSGTTISINTGDYPQTPLLFSKRGIVTVTNGGVVIH